MILSSDTKRRRILKKLHTAVHFDKKDIKPFTIFIPFSSKLLLLHRLFRHVCRKTNIGIELPYLYKSCLFTLAPLLFS